MKDSRQGCAKYSLRFDFKLLDEEQPSIPPTFDQGAVILLAILVIWLTEPLATTTPFDEDSITQKEIEEAIDHYYKSS